MPRIRPEWFLVPLVVLPLAVVAVLTVAARTRYFDELGRYRREGARLLEARVAGHDARWQRRFRDALPEADGAGWVRCRVDGVEWRVHAPGVAPEEWIFASRYPGGLTAAALADAETRLAVESGRRPEARLDAGARLFLAVRRDPALLRSAALPPSTKRFLAPDDPALRRFLDAARELLDAPTTPGVHRRGEQTFVVAGGSEPRRLYVGAAPPPWEYFEEASSNVRLRFSTEGERGALWQERRAAPLAGTWAFVAPHGSRWWRSAVVQRWWTPVAAALFGFLLLPVALFWSLRQQRRLDDARVRFLTELAHDLRTPLTAVRLHAEMLASGRTPDEKRERTLHAMARESSRLSALLANLLDLSRLERGRREYELAPTAVADVAADAARDFGALYPARADDLEVSGPPGATVVADRTALHRCLANLLDNAGKFTAAGTRIRLGWDESGILRVADDGPGVAPEQRARLFERYARAAPAGVPGTGLGLSLVRELAEGMGGGARIVGSPRGTCVELRLRRVRDA